MPIEDVNAAVAAYGAEQYAAGAASTKPQIDQLAQDLAAKTKELEDYKAAHPDQPVPPPPVPTGVFEIGAAVGSNTDPTAFEKRLGKPLDARRTYESGAASQQIADTLARIKADITAGRKTSSPSVKVPVPMATAAAGAADSWALELALGIFKLVEGTDHKVRIAINHEPENDVKIQRGTDGKISNGPAIVKYRDDWIAFQNRVAGFFDLPGITFIVILMGDHQWNTGANYYPWWAQNKVIPRLTDTVKGVGYDYYERYSNTHKKWTDWGWLAKAETWFALNKRPSGQGYLWGLSETAWTEEAEIAKPGQAQAMRARLVGAGGSWMEYFNTNLNSSADWEMVPGDNREKGFALALKENR